MPVMVNECAGLTPSDWLYWLLSCWALPSFSGWILPILASVVAAMSAHAVRGKVGRL